MKSFYKKPPRCVCGLLLWLVAAVTAVCPGETFSSVDIAATLVPLQEHAGVAGEIARFLARRHYTKRPFDDTLSEKIYTRYLEELDPSRSFFCSSDITEFEAYRRRLDDSLKTGNLEPAFHIYNRYLARQRQRYVYMLDLLENGLNDVHLDRPEVLDLDRDDDPWPSTVSGLHDRWRKLFKNSLINLLLSGKTLEEASKTLSHRYTSALSRLGQTTSTDVFAAFCNVLTQTYDPHTQYLPPRQSENFNINMSLSLEGIGVLLQTENEHTKVVRIIPGGPADKANNLKPADKIVGVGQGSDGDLVDIVGWRIDDVVELIRGPKQTVVRLEIIPADTEEISRTTIIEIVRDTVMLEEQSVQKNTLSIERGQATYSFGVLKIPAFYQDFRGHKAGNPYYRSTTRDTKKLLEQLSQEKPDGLIIDLRDNSGGALEEVTALSGLFIAKGPIVQVRGADSRVNVLRDRDPRIMYRGPLLVLVNRLSASASEIFAGAMQDYNRAIILGQQTFGKGTVQALVDLSCGQLKATQAAFYRINGKSTQHRGVTPDIMYPDLYNTEKIGERALPGALPWDAIQAVPYRPFAESFPVLERLREHHAQRMKDDPDYTYLIALKEQLLRQQDKTLVSLELKERKQQQKHIKKQRLELENARRKAKHLPPLPTYAAWEKELAERDGKTDPQDDAMLVEGANILIDFISLSTTPPHAADAPRAALH